MRRFVPPAPFGTSRSSNSERGGTRITGQIGSAPDELVEVVAIFAMREDLTRSNPDRLRHEPCLAHLAQKAIGVKCGGEDVLSHDSVLKLKEVQHLAKHFIRKDT